MTEAESFDTEAVLRDILDVLRKHAIPIQTVSLDVSMLDADFDATIPQLKTYKMGNFHRPKTIDGVEMLFEIKRRLPFDHFATRLEQEILPTTQAFADELMGIFPDLHITSEAKRGTNDAPLRPQEYYSIVLMCRFTDDMHANYNMLHFAVSLAQHEGTSYPLIKTYVGWLVDEESGGDWGLDVVRKQFSDYQEVSDSIVTMMVTTLYNDLQAFKREIEQHLEWKPYDGRKPHED